jgi:hypothetical protein
MGSVHLCVACQGENSPALVPESGTPSARNCGEAALKGSSMKRKYEQKVRALLAQEEHLWLQGLSPEEAAKLRETHRERYDQ